MKKKSGPSWGRDPGSQLLKTATRYIESNGGKVIVIGGIQLQHWPEDQNDVYYLAVKFTGRKPKSPKEN